MNGIKKKKPWKRRLKKLIVLLVVLGLAASAVRPVSYTHLDVYKRQAVYSPQGAGRKSTPVCA